MSRGILKLEKCAKRGVPVEMPLLTPAKAKKRGYLEIKAYDDKVISRKIEDNDLMM